MVGTSRKTRLCPPQRTIAHATAVRFGSTISNIRKLVHQRHQFGEPHRIAGDLDLAGPDGFRKRRQAEISPRQFWARRAWRP